MLWWRNQTDAEWKNGKEEKVWGRLCSQLSMGVWAWGHQVTCYIKTQADTAERGGMRKGTVSFDTGKPRTCVKLHKERSPNRRFPSWVTWRFPCVVMVNICEWNHLWGRCGEGTELEDIRDQKLCYKTCGHQWKRRARTRSELWG